MQAKLRTQSNESEQHVNGSVIIDLSGGDNTLNQSYILGGSTLRGVTV